MTGIVRLDPALVALEPQLPEGPALMRTSGIWEAEPCTEHLPSYPCDEVCVVLEGTIHLQLPDGSVQSFAPGEAVAIAYGTECTWHQDDRVRKFSVIRERS